MNNTTAFGGVASESGREAAGHHEACELLGSTQLLGGTSTALRGRVTESSPGGRESLAAISYDDGPIVDAKDSRPPA